MKAIAVSLDEIIFENRNKDYGAYALRRVYSKNVMKALTLGIFLFLGVVSIPLIARYLGNSEYTFSGGDVTADFIPPPDEKVDIKEKKVEPPKQNVPVFAVPIVVVDTNEVKGDLMAGQDNAKNQNPLDTSSTVLIGGGGDDDKPVLDKPKDDEKPFIWVEEMPKFPGGEEERVKFLSNNISYPKIARELGIQGPVYLTFVVNENGKISDVTIARGIGGGCDEEALRVIKKMPDWNPGRQNGIAVKVMLSMMINFRLEAK